jgi:hypothetical protein
MAIDIRELIREWWDFFQPDPRADFDNIDSGLRKQLPTEGQIQYEGGVIQPISDSQRQTGACQYWIRGLPAVCENWNHKKLKCGYQFENVADKPSGYGLGSCDMLGRRSWCSKYEGGEENLEEYVCVAPCPERSGLGKQITVSGTVSGTVSVNTLSYRPVLPSEIKGYNADEDGVGRCDGWGMGRGNQKEEYTLLEQIYLDPPICRHYRPQQMGFGAIQPHPFHGSEEAGQPFNPKVNWIPKTLKKLHDGSKADPLTALNIRLPYAFQVYNIRAAVQKCAHWKNDTPSYFNVSDESDISLNSIYMEDESYCECQDSSLCDPFRNTTDAWTSGLTYILQDVWAPYGGIVCNGAKPECPCYTGKWIYCIDNNLRDGMRITADQIFEMRFWASNWASQEEYDAYYLKKPGVTKDEHADESTADIYTFTKWRKINVNDPNESEMLGYKHHMCMPAPLNMRDFDPDVYIEKTPVEYPKARNFKGTSMIGGEVTYPTLVRALDDPLFFIPDILLIYPYFSKDPWEATPCDQQEYENICYHDTNSMDAAYISAVGKCLEDKTIYVVNKDLLEVKTESSRKVFEYMDKYARSSQATFAEQSVFNDFMEDFIDECIEEPLGFSTDQTDENGYFNINDIELLINKLNNLYIICDYTGDTSPAYTYRKVKVQSRYWGALIEQSQAIHKQLEAPTANYFPERFNPAVTVHGSVNTTRGEVYSVFSTHATYGYGLTGDTAYYSYCINEYEEEVDDVEKWSPIGSSSYIWAEIDDVELTYLFEFEVIEAYLTYTGDTEEGKKRINFCGQDAYEDNVDVALSFEYPLNSTERKTIPPNAVILKANSPMAFSNNDWTLYIKYRYEKLETHLGDSVVWPTTVDFGLDKFVPSRYTVVHEMGEEHFTIAGVGGYESRGSAKVMAYIVDENYRIQAAAATKMLLQGCEIGCRSVDIYYKYTADALGYDLQPAYGFFTWRGSPTANRTGNVEEHAEGVTVEEFFKEGMTHVKKANCGDHQCNPGNCIGPMWFPFETCTEQDYYNVLNGAAECTMAITEIKDAVGEAFSWATHFKPTVYPGYWRYCAAPEYEAWVTPGGNWASACGSSFFYHYSRAEMSGMRFTGWGNKKAKIDVEAYLAYDWALPPFGNGGRGYVERYLTRDYVSFFDLSGPMPEVKYEYMPMIFDKEDIIQDLDCFAVEDEYSPLHEPFSHFSMLSNYVSSTLGEEMSGERYRFKDIIEVVFHANCMYPYPLIHLYNNIYRVMRYGFKNNEHVWAWPDWWKELERNIDEEENKFTFVTLVRPEYYFDYNKEEHRFITYEGEHTIIFQPPTGEENLEPGDDSKSAVYPSICLDGKYPRYFNIVYDSYGAEQVEWMDESGTGEEGASGGDDGEGTEGSIYELANNGINDNGIKNGDSETQWGHDFNTLFDEESGDEPSEDRKLYLGKDELGEDVYVYYNTGLIANITKDRLIYLPMEESLAQPPESQTVDADKVYSYWILDEYGLAPVSVKIEGYYGSDSDETTLEGNEEIFSIPSIEVRETDKEVVNWDDGEVVGVRYSETGVTELDGRKEYTVVLDLSRDPRRFTKTWKFFMVELLASNGEKIEVSSLDVTLGKYVKSEEKIKVWEHKYYVGKASLPDTNADGPYTEQYRTYDRDKKNAGQYFPFIDDFTNNVDPNIDDDINFEQGGKVVSKLNMVGFTEIQREDERLPLTIDNLKYHELNAQSDLYNEALDTDDYDELIFTGVMPPRIRERLGEINATLSSASSLVLYYKKLAFENTEKFDNLHQDIDVFQPGGHYFAWSDNAVRTRCYIYGPVQTVYDVDWVHWKHGGREATLDAGQSWAGWGRLEYYEGRLWQMGLLDITGTQHPGSTDLLTGAKNATKQQSA